MRNAKRIAQLNDRLRKHSIGGQVVITSGIAALSYGEVDLIVAVVRRFDAFTPENDPYGEHDFGALIVGERKIMFKIDYNGPVMGYGSAEADYDVRLMTIMLSEEW